MSAFKDTICIVTLNPRSSRDTEPRIRNKKQSLQKVAEPKEHMQLRHHVRARAKSQNDDAVNGTWILQKTTKFILIFLCAANFMAGRCPAYVNYLIKDVFVFNEISQAAVGLPCSVLWNKQLLDGCIVVDCNKGARFFFTKWTDGKIHFLLTFGTCYRLQVEQITKGRVGYQTLKMWVSIGFTCLDIKPRLLTGFLQSFQINYEQISYGVSSDSLQSHIEFKSSRFTDPNVNQQLMAQVLFVCASRCE